MVIVTQLVKLTHTCCVPKLIHEPVGTTVHIQFITTAVHIVAHHVPYVNVTIDPSAFHVPLTHGYCVLYELHDAGCVIVTVPGLKYAI